MDSSGPARSSWWWRGRPVPFLPLDPGEEFYRAFDKTALRSAHERALAVADRGARIPIEETDAEILLLSGTADGVWPSTPMADAVVRAAAEAGRAARVGHVAFEGTGHFFAVPGTPADRPDGAPGANAHADRKSWGALRRHLGLS